jgi:hypothetical protein
VTSATAKNLWEEAQSWRGVASISNIFERDFPNLSVWKKKKETTNANANEDEDQ